MKWNKDEDEDHNNRNTMDINNNNNNNNAGQGLMHPEGLYDHEDCSTDEGVLTRIKLKLFWVYCYFYFIMMMIIFSWFFFYIITNYDYYGVTRWSWRWNWLSDGWITAVPKPSMGISLFLFLNINSFFVIFSYLQQQLCHEYQEYPQSIVGGQYLISCDGATDRPYSYCGFICDNKFRFVSLFLLLLWGAKWIGLKRTEGRRMFSSFGDPYRRLWKWL